jgi:hypothetical protein
VATPKKKQSSKPLTADQINTKIKADHRSIIRTILRGAGFRRIVGVADKEFTFEGQKSDFDDIFIYENVVLLMEYTTTQPSGVGDHLKPKKIIYDKIDGNPLGFLDFMNTKFVDSADQLKTNYHKSKIILKIVYCSRYEFEEHYKKNVPNPAFFDYPAVRYFSSVVDAIKKSALPELMHFLGIDWDRVGNNGQIAISSPGNKYPGSLLPEAHSNFDDGYKVVSFYADPESLLKTAYVLRKDG